MLLKMFNIANTRVHYVTIINIISYIHTFLDPVPPVCWGEIYVISKRMVMIDKQENKEKNLFLNKTRKDCNMYTIMIIK